MQNAGIYHIAAQMTA